MTLDDYRDVWQEQEPSDDFDDLEEVLNDMKERSEEYDRTIFWRDVREIGAAVLVAGFFGWTAVSAETLLTRIGALIVVAAAGLIVWKLRATRESGEDEMAGRPVAERLKAEIERVEDQIRLLENVLWWYLAPMGAGLVVMVASGGIEGWFEPVYLGGLVVFFGFVWWLNQRAVDRCYRPHRRDLVRTLRRIENGDAASPSR